MNAPAPVRTAPATATRLDPTWRPWWPDSRTPSHPAIPGFTFLGVGDFSCHNSVEGLRRFHVPIYRSNAFLEALVRMGQLPDDPDPKLHETLDTEFALLPPAEGEFLMARTPITRRVFAACRGDSAAAVANFCRSSPLAPVDGLTHFAAEQWCVRLGLAIPTRATWQFAAEAGTQTDFCFGATLDRHQANFGGTLGLGPGPGPTLVGSFPANAFGLFDFHGNVAEWCVDEERDSVPPRRAVCGGSFRSLDPLECASRAADFDVNSRTTAGLRPIRRLNR